MRAKIVFPLLLFTGLVLLLAGWFNFHPVRPAGVILGPVLAAQAQSNPAMSATNFEETLSPPVLLALPVRLTKHGEVAPDEQEDRIRQLESLAMNNDTDSLNLILCSLNDPNPQIRSATLEALVQFDSQAAIPALQDTLVKAEFPQETACIQGVIDFLMLPPLTSSVSQNP